jgi:hypothetical protein
MTLKCANRSWGAEDMMKSIAAIALVGVLSGCEMPTPQATSSPSGILNHATYKCTLIGLAASAGKQSKTVNMLEMSPFVLAHLSMPGEPNRFGISSSVGTTVGVGAKQPDGRWVINDWRPRDNSGPFLTLVTFLKNKSILISVKSGNNAHVTFAGQCKITS